MSDFSQIRDELSTGDLELLMVRYQSSDSDAGGLLVERMSTPIFRYFLGQVRNRAHAEDLLQDFWLRVHSARHTYRPGQPLPPWLYAIAHRVKIDDYRRNRNRRNQEPLQDYTAPSPAADHGGKAPVGELLRELPESQREAILMMKVGGLSLEEVARATGTSVGAVKQKVHRGYERLRALLRERT